MNIVLGILLGLLAGFLAWVYGKIQYWKGCEDGLNEARRILDKYIAEAKEKENGEKNLH